MVNFGHGGGQVLMGGEMDLEGLDGGGGPPPPPPFSQPLNTEQNSKIFPLQYNTVSK